MVIEQDGDLYRNPPPAWTGSENCWELSEDGFFASGKSSRRTCPEDPAEQQPHTAQRQSRPIGEAVPSLKFCSVLPYPSPPRRKSAESIPNLTVPLYFTPIPCKVKQAANQKKGPMAAGKRSRKPRFAPSCAAGPLLSEQFFRSSSAVSGWRYAGECPAPFYSRSVPPGTGGTPPWRRPPARWR